MILQLISETFSAIQEHQYYAFIAVCLTIILYKFFIYPFFISPLRNIPGPYLYRVSYIPWLNAQRKFRWIKTAHGLHQKYGNVVVVSPSAVSCNGDPKYVHDIYVKNMPKGSYYQNFKFHGEVNMFAELNNEKHLAYKKMIQGLYLKTSVFNPKNATRNNLIENVRELVNQVYLTSVSGKRPDYLNAELRLNKHGKGYVRGSGNWFRPEKKKSGIGIEVHSLFASLAMDVVSAFEIGVQNATNLLQNPEERRVLIYYRMVSSMGFWTTRMPRFWSWVAGKEIPAAAAELDEWHLSLYKRAEENVVLKEGQNPSTLETFKKNGLFGPRAYSNVSDNLIAGHDTTSVMLTYMCFELSRPVNRDFQARLREELRDTFGNPGDLNTSIDDLETVDKLPYLEALVQENLRVHAPTSGPEPRVTDSSYQICVNGKTVIIPVGTEMSCQPYLMHRVKHIFTDPEKWLPERWLQKRNESREQYNSRLKEMQRYMIPFGKGIRMCIGVNIALIEIKLALANLYWRYELGLCSDWCEITPAEKSGIVQMGNEYAVLESDESMMTKVDAYITRPYYDECWLEWSKV